MITWLLTAGCSLAVIWAVLSQGGNVPLGARDKVILILVATAEIELLAIVRLIEKVKELRLTSSADYVNFMKRKEDEYFDSRAEIRQLQKDLAFEQGKANINDIYLQKFTEKPTYSGAKMVSEENNRFVSADGLSAKEKYRRAYALHTDGWSNADIAQELGIAVGSVAVYISKGRKEVQVKPEDLADGPTETGGVY